MSIPVPFGLPTVTGGLSTTTGPSQLLTGGMPYVSAPLPPNLTPPLPVSVADTVNGLPGSTYTTLADTLPVRNLNGSVIVPTNTGFVDLGQGYNMAFDPDTLQGKITPVIGNLTQDADIALGDPVISYSGSDVRILLEPSDQPQVGNTPSRLHKQLIECTTISIGVFRVKSPAVAAGYIGAKGYGRGRRTIAGTIILTQFSVDVLRRFLQPTLLNLDGSKDSHYAKADQLPPFNMTILFTNEMGLASYCRVLGVEVQNSGVTYSHNDLYTEQSMSYMAADLTPLLSVTHSSFWKKAPNDRRTSRERTVQDVWDTPPNPPFTNPDISV